MPVWVRHAVRSENNTAGQQMVGGHSVVNPHRWPVHFVPFRSAPFRFVRTAALISDVSVFGSI